MREDVEAVFLHRLHYRARHIGGRQPARRHRLLEHLLALIVCIALVSAVLWWMLRIAHAVGERMGTTGLNIATRLLGLILAAIAIETMADGLKQLFPGLA